MGHMMCAPLPSWPGRRIGMTLRQSVSVLGCVSILLSLAACKHGDVFPQSASPLPRRVQPSPTAPPATASSTATTAIASVVPCPSLVGDPLSIPYPTPGPSTMRPFSFRKQDRTLLYQGLIAFTRSSTGSSEAYAVFIANTGALPVSLNLSDFVPIPLQASDMTASIVPVREPGAAQVLPNQTSRSGEFMIRTGTGSMNIRVQGLRWRLAESDDVVEVPFVEATAQPVYATRSGC